MHNPTSVCMCVFCDAFDATCINIVYHHRTLFRSRPRVDVSAESAATHRLYDLEVIHMSDDVTFLLLLPPVDSVCSGPGTREQLTKTPGYITLPIEVFEMST